MTLSQLAIEYEGMPERYELYAKFGITAEAAQLFETDLGTLILALRGIENDWHVVPDGEAARSVLDGIERSTLGKLLKLLGGYIKLEGGLEDKFSSALVARNRLMHGWFEGHNFKIQTEVGRAEMIDDLDNLHAELFNAWQLAGMLSAAFVAAMTELKISDRS
jgi:hypothetical protein